MRSAAPEADLDRLAAILAGMLRSWWLKHRSNNEEAAAEDKSAEPEVRGDGARSPRR